MFGCVMPLFWRNANDVESNDLITSPLNKKIKLSAVWVIACGRDTKNRWIFSGDGGRIAYVRKGVQLMYERLKAIIK